MVLLIFSAFYYFNAYVCDDAFIAFRTLDNFVRGHGLRWNVLERVQVFTSPLFTLLTGGLYWFVHDRGPVPDPDRIYFLSLGLSYLLAAGSLLWIAATAGDRRWSWFGFAILMSSQAFVTFTSSGLETPLTYLFAALFFATFLRGHGPPTRRQCAWLFGLAGLGVLTRLDAALLYLPACGHLLISGARTHGRRIVGPVLLPLLPLVAWLAFSLTYFGFPLPNSYYAKVGIGVDRSILHEMGWDYLRASFAQDPVTLAVICAGTLLSLLALRTASVGLAGALYVLYIFDLGGDFIGHRFLAAPFLLSTLVILHACTRRLGRWGAPGAALGVVAALLYGSLTPSSPLRAFRDPPAATDVRFYFDASALSRWRPGMRFPFARFLDIGSRADCEQMRATAFTVSISNDGLEGFCRGPLHHMVDVLGITDPLLARITVQLEGPFKPGHIVKPVPKGYLESIRARQNLVEDPEVAAFYELLRSVVSAPLLDANRWRAVAELNLRRSRLDLR